MISGLHAMVYSSDAPATREFLRDVLGFPATDTGDGWLVFAMPEAELGCHPTGHEGSPPPGTHELSFYCEDIKATMSALRAKGVSFLTPVRNQGYGLVTQFEMPGGVKADLYQPLYELAGAQGGSQ